MNTEQTMAVVVCIQNQIPTQLSITPSLHQPKQSHSTHSCLIKDCDFWSPNHNNNRHTKGENNSGWQYQFFMEYIDRGIRSKGRFVEMNGKILVYTIRAKTGHEICNMADSDQWQVALLDKFAINFVIGLTFQPIVPDHNVWSCQIIFNLVARTTQLQIINWEKPTFSTIIHVMKMWVFPQ